MNSHAIVGSAFIINTSQRIGRCPVCGVSVKNFDEAIEHTFKEIKMNPEQLLNQAEEAIAHRPDSAARNWWVCYVRGKIRCVPTLSIIDDGNIFGTYTTDELRIGLTINQWDLMCYKMSKFFRERKP